VVGSAASGSGNRHGGYFEADADAYAYVGTRYGGTAYKVNGRGAVSTIMATREGRKNLFSPEMPEAWFEDVGHAQLTSGHCRVNLDPLFTDCVSITDAKPLEVFVQLKDECRGVYVRSDANGFDVYELQGGSSNARFSWRVLGKWKGLEALRFPDGPPPMERASVDKETGE
jgi:hypothetical protein